MAKALIALLILLLVRCIFEFVTPIASLLALQIISS